MAVINKHFNYCSVLCDYAKYCDYQQTLRLSMSIVIIYQRCNYR